MSPNGTSGLGKLAVNGRTEQHETHERMDQNQQEPCHAERLARIEPPLRDRHAQVFQRPKREVERKQYESGETQPLVQDEHRKVLPRNRARDVIAQHRVAD